MNDYRIVTHSYISCFSCLSFNKYRNYFKLMKVPPKDSIERKNLIDYVCLLRYKTSKPNPESLSFLNLAYIKKIIGYSEKTIVNLCQERFE